MARSTSSRVTSLTLSWVMVIVIASTSSPRRFGEACNIRSAVPNFRVIARQTLVKNILDKYLGRFAPSPLGPPANTPPLPAEDIPFKTRNNRHGILSVAETDIPLVPETRETPGDAVAAQNLLGAREVESD